MAATGATDVLIDVREIGEGERIPPGAIVHQFVIDGRAADAGGDAAKADNGALFDFPQ
jgi:hypothetical protein